MGFMYMLVEYRYKLENNDIFYYMYNGSHFLFHMFLILNRMNNCRYTDPLKNITLDVEVKLLIIPPRKCRNKEVSFVHNSISTEENIK